jgi:hypothetical protein
VPDISEQRAQLMQCSILSGVRDQDLIERDS